MDLHVGRRALRPRCFPPRPLYRHRLCWQLPVALLAWASLQGCASLVEVRSLATGRVAVSAYELRGNELAPLQREARRLCPQGGEILRQSGRDLVPEHDEGRVRRWLNNTSEWFDPPTRNAQLVVVCKVAPDDAVLASSAAASAATAATAATADAAASAASHSIATVPLGPLTVEW